MGMSKTAEEFLEYLKRVKEFQDGAPTVGEFTKVLEAMPRDFDVKFANSGSPQVLMGTRVLDNVKYFAFDVFYTCFSIGTKAPKDKKLKVGELLDMLKEIPADYNVGIIDHRDCVEDTNCVNEMAITSIGLSADMVNTTEDYVNIETGDNDDEERYGRPVKF